MISHIGNYERRQCGCKQRYTSEEIVNNKRDELYLQERVPFNVYFCKFCHHWHVGKSHGKIINNILKGYK